MYLQMKYGCDDLLMLRPCKKILLPQSPLQHTHRASTFFNLKQIDLFFHKIHKMHSTSDLYTPHTWTCFGYPRTLFTVRTAATASNAIHDKPFWTSFQELFTRSSALESLNNADTKQDFSSLDNRRITFLHFHSFSSKPFTQKTIKCT